jgi:hypothetical protein
MVWKHCLLIVRRRWHGKNVGVLCHGLKHSGGRCGASVPFALIDCNGPHIFASHTPTGTTAFYASSVAFTILQNAKKKSFEIEPYVLRLKAKHRNDDSPFSYIHFCDTCNPSCELVALAQLLSPVFALTQCSDRLSPPPQYLLYRSMLPWQLLSDQYYPARWLLIAVPASLLNSSKHL